MSFLSSGSVLQPPREVPGLKTRVYNNVQVLEVYKGACVPGAALQIRQFIRENVCDREMTSSGTPDQVPDDISGQKGQNFNGEYLISGYFRRAPNLVQRGQRGQRNVGGIFNANQMMNAGRNNAGNNAGGHNAGNNGGGRGRRNRNVGGIFNAGQIQNQGQQMYAQRGVPIPVGEVENAGVFYMERCALIYSDQTSVLANAQSLLVANVLEPLKRCSVYNLERIAEGAKINIGVEALAKGSQRYQHFKERDAKSPFPYMIEAIPDGFMRIKNPYDSQESVEECYFKSESRLAAKEVEVCANTGLLLIL